MIPKIDKETVLVRSLKNGDIDAFNLLFNDYSRRLYQFAISYLKSANDAEEIVQEVFVKVWSRRKELDPNGAFKSYLFTIAFNFVKRKFNTLAKEKAFQNEILYTHLSDENNLDKVIDYKFLLEKVEKIINSMPPRRKQIFIKRKYDDLSIKQIASDMGISPNTVENQLSEAQKYIRNQMEKDKIAGMLFFTLFIK